MKSIESELAIAEDDLTHIRVLVRDKIRDTKDYDLEEVDAKLFELENKISLIRMKWNIGDRHHA